MSNQLIDLTGKQFGHLTVISRAANDRGGHTQWLCQCDCGTQKTVRGAFLRSCRVTSCGCGKYGPHPSKSPDLAGQRFGSLLVMERASPIPSRRVRWVCECDCGAFKTVLATDLQNGSVTSCGCRNQRYMILHEVTLNDKVMEQLIQFSEDWATENSCYGYRTNDRTDIEGNRIFFAEDRDTVIGYLFGKVYRSKQMKSIMPEGTPYFEVEELYVVPERRSQGVGAKLFRYVEEAVKPDAEYMVLSTATKNWKAVFHFYLDELGMTFWSARLFKKIEK